MINNIKHLKKLMKNILKQKFSLGKNGLIHIIKLKNNKQNMQKLLKMEIKKDKKTL
jgi:hypothetical protein